MFLKMFLRETEGEKVRTPSLRSICPPTQKWIKKNGNAAVRDFMFSRSDICEMITWDVCHCAVHIDGDDCNAIQFKYVFTVRPNIRPHVRTHRYVQEAQFIRELVAALNPVNNKGLHQG